MRFAHTMLRVKDLDKSIDFYTNILGMKVLKKSDNPQYKYTLAFLGYGDINANTALELTYNWGDHEYDHGNAFGHLCMEVNDVYKTCDEIKAKGGIVTREAGPVKGGTSIIAFIKDPDGYQIELIDEKVR
ncbi:lactoylglutathione lyase [Francisella frigiditurris]|uniref:lactoylglutathione lyase n=1 Tax=Francisella frigiditurris TaxID=1542390 RepID=A0A1J0KUA2_9GAMM|nr:lactoylglutathione lyase [Francisella frigiditurris]APC97267.1 lactoylglutathione lyase [Francisella frigiditurris]